jgi:hypothetical protein
MSAYPVLLVTVSVYILLLKEAYPQTRSQLIRVKRDQRLPNRDRQRVI